MRYKSELLDDKAVRRSLVRIAHEIIEHNHGAQDIVLIGIKRRGLPLAEHIAGILKDLEGFEIPVGFVDITLYRDDLSEVVSLPDAFDSMMPCDITGKRLILVDDVLYTGRTVRAAIEGIFSYGRPACIQLAVLIDRGHRELPIRPDFVGKNIPTSREEHVAVAVPGVDEDVYSVSLYAL